MHLLRRDVESIDYRSGHLRRQWCLQCRAVLRLVVIKLRKVSDMRHVLVQWTDSIAVLRLAARALGRPPPSACLALLLESIWGAIALDLKLRPEYVTPL
jgi:hypothetical protein